MRDYRDAKVMAHTLRASLASRGTNVTLGQSLELIAQIFGLPDWNRLAAAIRGYLLPTQRRLRGSLRMSRGPRALSPNLT